MAAPEGVEGTSASLVIDGWLSCFDLMRGERVVNTSGLTCGSVWGVYKNLVLEC